METQKSVIVCFKVFTKTWKKRAIYIFRYTVDTVEANKITWTCLQYILAVITLKHKLKPMDLLNSKHFDLSKPKNTSGQNSDNILLPVSFLVTATVNKHTIAVWCTSEFTAVTCPNVCYATSLSAEWKSECWWVLHVSHCNFYHVELS